MATLAQGTEPVKSRIEVRADHCLGEPRTQIVVHLPAELVEQVDEIAKRIAGLMNEIQKGDEPSV